MLLARAWAVREADVDLPVEPDATMPDVDHATTARFFELRWDEGCHTSMELRTTRGDFDEPGHWVGLDSRTRFGTGGIGLATSTIHGEQGMLGIGSQGLLVEPR